MNWLRYIKSIIFNIAARNVSVLIKIWCKIPRCWYYTVHSHNGNFIVCYIWAFRKKWEVAQFPIIYRPLDVKEESN